MTAEASVLVTGATGTVGRQVATRLLGSPVQTLAVELTSKQYQAPIPSRGMR